MILGLKDVEFQVELQDPKKSTFQKYPRQLDSNGRPVMVLCQLAFLAEASKDSCQITHSWEPKWDEDVAA